MPDDYTYAIDPTRFGLPTREELVEMRIWDLHFHGFGEMDKVLPYIKRMGIERLFSLDIGGSWYYEDRSKSEELIDKHKKMLEQWEDLVAGIIRIAPGQPDESLAWINRWVADGPAVGIKYAGRYPKDITCAHPNNDPIVRKADELGAIIYIHTWIKVGGEPRYPGGGNFSGESTPMDVAELASRFPEVPLICGHQGGDWELGVRAVRPHENVYFEFSGSEPNAGDVDFAVQELGADRLVWGGHLPSRSYANELSSVYGADLTKAQRKQVLGGNLRRLAAPIMRRKGYEVEI